MNNKIKNELENAKSYMLNLMDGNELVELSLDNVAKVEAMLMIDSSYRKSSNIDAEPTTKYNGSSAHWLIKFKSILENDSVVYSEDDKNTIREIINALDRENSTHLNADGVGRIQIYNRIISIPKNTLIDYLKKPESTNFKLINIISAETKPTGISVNGKPYKPRKNLSFASKFCHYTCFYVFEGEKEQDNFPIYDSVISKILPKYLKRFECKKYNIEDYSQYKKAIDEVLEKSGNKISRNGFDHLIWYYYKGR